VPRSRSEEMTGVVVFALRHPRGSYPVERAAQLSGVPRSTLYDWRGDKVYVPDFDRASPVLWSYRDLVYLRLLAWLRQLGMARPTAARQVAGVKERVSRGADVRMLQADRNVLLIGDERATDAGGPNLLPFDDLSGLLATFDLLDPIEELRRRGQKRVWAPDLVTPGTHTSISPWVLAGDPCIRNTRIPTAAIRALHEDRGLAFANVVQLYPGLTREAAEDAYLLERRLRGLELPERAAA
jgi:uncharacterized protein (DUF433 family)